jgi:hypothetical protein
LLSNSVAVSRNEGTSMNAGAFYMFAERLLAAGYSPLPIIPGQKKPALRSWSNFCTEPMAPPRLRSYGARWPRASLGVALGYAGVIALDVDTEDPEQLAAISGALPASPVSKAGAKGFTAFYRAVPGACIRSRHYVGTRKRGIADLLSVGTQTVLPPSPHPSGYVYRWLTADTLLSVPANELPQAPADIAERLETALASWMPRRLFVGAQILRTRPPERHELRRLNAFANAGLARRARELASTGEGGRNNALFTLGAGLGRFVFHGVLSLAALETAALAACEANGLLREDGRLAVLATLHKGLARAKDDALPQLAERRHVRCA